MGTGCTPTRPTQHKHTCKCFQKQAKAEPQSRWGPGWKAPLTLNQNSRTRTRGICIAGGGGQAEPDGWAGSCPLCPPASAPGPSPGPSPQLAQPELWPGPE